MNFSRFFIDRPIFAAVLSLLIVVGGGLAVLRLPISEGPAGRAADSGRAGDLPGANPRVIAETVASPLEHQLTGVEDMLYMNSQATADGVMTRRSPSASGRSRQRAGAGAEPRRTGAAAAAAEVQRIGVTTEKSSPDLMMVVHLSRRTRATTSSIFRITRTCGPRRARAHPGHRQRAGVRRRRIQHARVARSRSAGVAAADAADVVSAIREQNVQVAAGVLGAPPAPTDTTFQLSINARGRLTTDDEFADVIVHARKGRSRLRDVGRVELGSNAYAAEPARQPAGGRHRHLPASGSNAIEPRIRCAR